MLKFPLRGLAAALGAALMLSLPVSPASAEPARYVIDPDHFTVAIKVRHIGYFDMIGLFTEAAGSFVFANVVPNGDYRLRVRKQGYRKVDTTIRVDTPGCFASSIGPVNTSPSGKFS